MDLRSWSPWWLVLLVASLALAAPASNSSTTTTSGSSSSSSSSSSAAPSSSPSSSSATILTSSSTTPTPPKTAEEEERPAKIEQVPPPSPLITESANKGYNRMPGLYAFGSEPFVLERDPVTGNLDFSQPGLGDTSHKFSSKVSQPTSHDYYDDEEIAIHDENVDPIDRKDTLGSSRPNGLKDNSYYPANSYPEKGPPKDKFPLISSSYANTKVQGMGIVKQDPQKPVTSTVSYKSTTENILDFWPQKSSSEAPPLPPDVYDYYEEVPESPAAPEEEEELEEELPSKVEKVPGSTTKAPASQSVVYSKPFVPTPLPDAEEEVIPSRPPSPAPKPFSKPYGYEEPFRPIYGSAEGEDGRPDSIDNVPNPPSIYNLPPRIDVAANNRPESFNAEKRPIQTVNFNSKPIGGGDDSIFSPPPVPIYNQQPGPQRRPAPFPPSIVPQPPKLEVTRFPEDDEELQHTLRPPHLDSQGWKQATFTSSPPTSSSVQFPEETAPENFTPPPPAPRPGGPILRQPLPPGYEPQRPLPPFPNQQRIRPRIDPPQRRPLIKDGNRPVGFDGPRPQFPRPHVVEVPVRQKFDTASRPVLDARPHPSEGAGRPQFEGSVVKGNLPQQPPRRWDDRPPRPENANSHLPNILPQFRPNYQNAYDKVQNFRRAPPPPPPNTNRRQSVGISDRLYPPPPPPPHVTGAEEISPQRFQSGPPLVGRRVGSQVSTLQMMQQAALPKPVSREEAPQANPPVVPYEVRPTKYGSQPQSTEDRSVFVVYANSGENQQPAGDVHVGTHGLHKPVPPSHLTDEEPVLVKRPPPNKNNFPYALEKPSEDKTTTKEGEKDEEINIIPNLQDYMPFAIKSKPATSSTFSPSSSSSQHKSPAESTTESRPTIQSFIRPQSNGNEFTVSAVMHAGSHAPGTGASSIMVVAPDTGSSPLGSSSPQSFNFQAPFHASANIDPSPGNGWNAVKSSAIGEDTLKPGLVDRADVMEEMGSFSAPTKFDIENFQPELIGGFKPIYSVQEPATSTGSTSAEKHENAGREERHF